MSGKQQSTGRRRHAVVGADAVLVELGDRVRAARLASDMTQEELALVTGLDRKVILAVENARPGVAIGKVSRIVTALGLQLRAVT